MALVVLAVPILLLNSNGEDIEVGSPINSPFAAGPSLNFTFLDHDAVSFGSTAFKVFDDDLTIFIEAFPNVTACDWDPETIKQADIIIQNVHGHVSHYDADECATVALNTGAYVVGNSQLKSDMTSRGVPSSQIVELSPTMGNKVKKTISSLGVKITAFGMDHTMMSGTKVDTFLVEMPSGIQWYHGTCSSESNTYNYMDNHDELEYKDLMILDFDVFDDTNPSTRWHPESLIEAHDFNTLKATVYEDYSTIHSVLNHNDTYEYIRPEYFPELSGEQVEPQSGDPLTDFTFSMMYKYRLNQEPTMAQIVIDDVAHDMIKGSSSDYRVGVTYSYTTQLPAGTSQYHFEFEVDGKSVRLPETSDLTGPDVNAIPILHNELVDPQQGDDETDFTFSVIYQDDDDDFAIDRNIYLDGTKERMSTNDNNPISGMNYTYTSRLSIGSHSYYFEFSDGKNTIRYPEAGEFQIPDVVRANYAPVLQTAEHEPPYGHRFTEFTFAIKYRDSHGDEPSRSVVVLDGSEHEMTPMGTNYVKGVTFVYKTTLSLGPHEYHFEFSEADFDVRFPAENGIELEGPLVENRDPAAVISHPIEYGEFADDIPILLDASNSTDIDGDHLNFTWSSDIDGELGSGQTISVILSEGQHSINLEIEDGYGGTATMQRNIMVIHYEAVLILDLDISPSSPKEGQDITATVKVSNVGNIGADPFHIALYLDDEEIKTRSMADLLPGKVQQFEAVFTSNPGDHVLHAMIMDITSTYNNFTVMERPSPIADAGSDLTLDLGAKAVFDASGSIYEGALTIFEWDLDDGNTSTGIFVEHVYSKAGVYNVTLVVKDDLGKTSTDTITVTVIDPVQNVVEPDDKGKDSTMVVAIAIVVVLVVLICGLIIGALLIMKRRKSEAGQTPVPPIPPQFPPQPLTPPLPSPQGDLQSGTLYQPGQQMYAPDSGVPGGLDIDPHGSLEQKSPGSL
jgi:hypothetical protein